MHRLKKNPLKILILAIRKMGIFFKILTVFLLLFILSTPPSTAEILSAKIRSDKRDMILFSKFGFSHSGYVSIAVSNVSFTSHFPLPPPDTSRLGFMLLPHEYSDELDKYNDLCPLDYKFVKVLFTFQDLSSPPNQPSFNKSYHVTYPNLYKLYFFNCDLSHVSMDVHTELYNINNDGVTKSYLSAESPSLYFCYSYLALLLLWILVCLGYRRSLHMVHLLMGVFLLISAFHFFVVSKGQDYVNLTGDSHGWDVLFCVYQFMRTEALFVVMVLTGFGWGLWNSRLRSSRKLLLISVILLQVLVNALSIKAMEAVPYINDDRENWMAWSSGIDMMCGILASVYIIIAVIDLDVDDDKFQGNATSACFLFYMMVFIYMLMPRVILRTLANFDSFPWVVHTAEETCILVICFIMFCLFKPFDDKHCLWWSLDNQLPTVSVSRVAPAPS